MIGISVAANKEWNCVREYLKISCAFEEKGITRKIGRYILKFFTMGSAATAEYEYRR